MKTVIQATVGIIAFLSFTYLSIFYTKTIFFNHSKPKTTSSLYIQASPQELTPQKANPTALATTKKVFNAATNKISPSTATTNSNITVNNFTTSAVTNICNSLAADEIGGCVWEDWNYNGIYDENTPQGIASIAVILTNTCDNFTTNTTTDANGNYSFTVPNTSDTYRVEFSIPSSLSWAQPTKIGTDNGTKIQFVTAGTCTSLGLSSPSIFCEDEPQLLTPCYANGDPLANGTAGNVDALVKFPYKSAGQTGSSNYTGMPDILANFSEIGATWGTAYHRTRKEIYVGAILRRHAGFGTLGTGGIYKIDAAGNVTNWLDLNALGINTGIDPRTPFNGLPLTANELPADGEDPNWDTAARTQVGEISLGDLDISEDEQFLYVTNLTTKELIILDISGTTPTLSQRISIPTPTGCTPADARPWGLEIHKGKIYVGSVCSAESTGQVSDLNGVILEYDGTNWSELFTIPFNYSRRDMTNAPANSAASQPWYPWTDTYITVGNGTFDVYPQPIISDMEVDYNGDFIIGVLDRNAYQSGQENYTPNYPSTSVRQGISAGDLLRVCKVGNSYFLESNGSCGGITTIGDNDNDGVNGGEYYWGDQFDFQFYSDPNSNYATHPEIVLGGLAFRMGSGEVAATVYNPTQSANSGGTTFFDNQTGGRTQITNGIGSNDYGYRLFTSGGSGPTYLGKSAGLGDIEIMCQAAPLEIGNYVWLDENNDGIQDACEIGLDNIQVDLYDASCSNYLATTTTDTNGQYYFGKDGDANQTWFTTGDSLRPHTNYYIVVGNGQYSSATSLLTHGAAVYEITSTDAGANDELDSDGIEGGNSAPPCVFGLPFLQITTGAAGYVNHSYDFGFAPPQPCSLTASLTQACNDNNTPGIETDDYLIFAVSATGTNVGASNQFKVFYNGEEVGAATYGQTATIAFANNVGTQRFPANGASTYLFTIQDADDNTCMDTTTSTIESDCSNCPTICLPIERFIQRGL